jgi:hypothetical protein
MAQRRDTSCTGASIADRTIIISTRAALGTEAAATLAAVAVNLKKTEFYTKHNWRGSSTTEIDHAQARARERD